MKSLIPTTFLIHLVSVLSDTTEDKRVKELCSKSYFDRLITTDRLEKLERKEQVFHLYRSINQTAYHYWKVTVERSGVNKTLKPISFEYLLEIKELPKYQLTLRNVFDSIPKDTTVPNDHYVTNEWCTAYGFNALDNEYYSLVEDKTIRSLKPQQRSQYVYRIYFVIDSVKKEVTYKADKQWGQRPVLEFLGICPKDEVMPEEDDDEEDVWISDTVLFYMLGVLMIIAFVLPPLILWKLEGRYRFTQEIYDDSRMGSDSAIQSATHSSEDGPADLTGVVKVRLSQMKVNV